LVVPAQHITLAAARDHELGEQKSSLPQFVLESFVTVLIAFRWIE
jgi:hypothetical protein